jgi:hypothetical protein
MRSALLAADLVLIPVQPSPLDGWASAEMLALLRKRASTGRKLVARFVLNRCGARTVIARETAETLADHDPPVLATTIGQRVVFADAAQSGRLLAFEIDDATSRRARDRGARHRDRKDRGRRERSPSNGAASPRAPPIPTQWIKAAENAPARIRRAAFTARLTIDMTPELRGRIKIAAFGRGVTVADMLRELLAREFPSTPGDPT